MLILDRICEIQNLSFGMQGRVQIVGAPHLDKPLAQGTLRIENDLIRLLFAGFGRGCSLLDKRFHQ